MAGRVQHRTLKVEVNQTEPAAALSKRQVYLNATCGPDALLSLIRADASKLNSFHRKAAKAAEERKGFKNWRNETGKSSGKAVMIRRKYG